jgi:hypothetical protein
LTGNYQLRSRCLRNIWRELDGWSRFINAPGIAGAGLAIMRGSGSSFVHTSISFWLWIGDVRRTPPPFQPKPMARNVNSMTKFMVIPPASPAMRVLTMCKALFLLEGATDELDGALEYFLV